MIKSFLILINFSILLFSSEQIVLVVADDFNTSHAKLEFYDGNILLLKTEVNIGKNGLAWGIGEKKFKPKTDEPLKYEGDQKAPAGVFVLRNLFGYGYSIKSNLPYLHTSKDLICVDDSNDRFYNRIIQAHGNEKSFEHMKRKDHQYKYGVTVAHNNMGLKQRGSCIFLHIQREEGAGTAGCTSMREEDLKKLISFLDKKKHPILVQIPKSRAKEIKKLYPELQGSELLRDLFLH